MVPQSTLEELSEPLHLYDLAEILMLYEGFRLRVATNPSSQDAAVDSLSPSTQAT